MIGMFTKGKIQITFLKFVLGDGNNVFILVHIIFIF